MKYIISEQQFDKVFLSEQDEEGGYDGLVKKYLLFKYPEINNLWFGKRNVLVAETGESYVKTTVFVVFDVNNFLGSDGPHRGINYDVNANLARKMNKEVRGMFGDSYEVFVYKVKLEEA